MWIRKPLVFWEHKYPTQRKTLQHQATGSIGCLSLRRKDKGQYTQLSSAAAAALEHEVSWLPHNSRKTRTRCRHGPGNAELHMPGMQEHYFPFSKVKPQGFKKVRHLFWKQIFCQKWVPLITKTKVYVSIHWLSLEGRANRSMQIGSLIRILTLK
jgi:hypothetical protein